MWETLAANFSLVYSRATWYKSSLWMYVIVLNQRF